MKVLTHYIVYLKVIQYCKFTILQISKQIKKSNFLFQGIHAIPIKGV